MYDPVASNKRRSAALIAIFVVLTTLVVAFGGLIAVVFSDEWSEYTGRYGMTRDQFRTQPAWFVRISGVGMLGYAMYRAFGR